MHNGTESSQYLVIKKWWCPNGWFRSRAGSGMNQSTLSGIAILQKQLKIEVENNIFKCMAKQGVGHGFFKFFSVG
eukprot:XP_001709236.1 Hypothetical protein GL50803_89496 [Giardia lamblia ATCC 50803]